MDSDLLPGSLQWWHIVVSIFAVIFTIATNSFGKAFRQWADKLDNFTVLVNSRLDKMENEVANRLMHLEERYAQNEKRYHELAVQWERRVTWVEARMEKMREDMK